MRRISSVLSALSLAAILSAPTAFADEMKSTAPEKMTPPGDAAKMRACDEKAMNEKVPMAKKADFVKKCMAAMK